MITVSTLLLIAALTDPAPRPGSLAVRAATPSPSMDTPAVRRRPVRTARRVTPALRAVALANRAATIQPAASWFLNAAQVYPFTEGLVYQLYTRPGRVTDISLEPGEALVSVASGDTVRWVIGDTTSGSGEARRTHVLVKPFAAGLATNLIITTDRRSYHVSLASTGGSAIARVSWTYPKGELLVMQEAAQPAPAEPVPVGPALDALRFGYTISGHRPAWRPLRAFDDGRQTYIEVPPALAVGEAPPLFLVGAKGDAQLVNYRLRGRYYVVDRLFDTAELRLGTKDQQIVRIIRTGEAGEGRGR